MENLVVSTPEVSTLKKWKKQVFFTFSECSLLAVFSPFQSAHYWGAGVLTTRFWVGYFNLKNNISYIALVYVNHHAQCACATSSGLKRWNIKKLSAHYLLDTKLYNFPVVSTSAHYWKDCDNFVSSSKHPCSSHKYQWKLMKI